MTTWDEAFSKCVNEYAKHEYVCILTEETRGINSNRQVYQTTFEFIEALQWLSASPNKRTIVVSSLIGMQILSVEVWLGDHPLRLTKPWIYGLYIEDEHLDESSTLFYQSPMYYIDINRKTREFVDRCNNKKQRIE